MDLVAPEPRLRTKNKAQGAMLHTLMLLSQQTVFSVHLEDPEGPRQKLQWLCRAVSSQTLKPKDIVADLRNYYRGQGGHIISIDPSLISYDAATQSPPSYGLMASPPQTSSTLGKHGPSEAGPATA